MTFRKIPVNVPFWSNIEDESRSVVAEQRRDVIKDALGSTIRRPGRSEFATGLPAPADGMFYWKHTDLVYIVSSGDLYSLDKNGVVTLVGSSLFGSGKHVTWAESSDLTLVTSGAVRKLFASNGGRIVQYDGLTASKITVSNAPVESSHIIMFFSYLLSNELSDAKYDESILFSVVADPLTWNGEYFSAENKSDVINAIHTEWDEIALFGPESIENYYNDGVTPFPQIPGGTVQNGTRSPWSIKAFDNAYFFLNSDRRIVRLDGRQVTILSQAIDDILSEDLDFKNAKGEIFTLGGKALYLITISDRTFVYDISLNEWVGEWGYWNKSTAKHTAFNSKNFLNVKPWGATLCSDAIQGTIYKLDFDTYQDFGNEIRSSVITGQVDHSTGREKRSNGLRFRLKRGKFQRTSPTDPEPVLICRWRDNGSKVWSNDRDIMLGFTGDDEFYYSIYNLGSYRSRQYEFYCTDNVPFSIVEVEEDVVLLR